MREIEGKFYNAFSNVRLACPGTTAPLTQVQVPVVHIQKGQPLKSYISQKACGDSLAPLRIKLFPQWVELGP
jgi:hypothetical protein